MKVEIVRDVMINGEPAKAGSLLELPVADAYYLIGVGKAVQATEAPVEEVVPAEEPVKVQPKRGRHTTGTDQ